MGCISYIPESPLLKKLAGARVATRVAVAGVYHVLTVVAVVTRGAATVVKTLRQRFADTLVGAGVCEASVAFGQDIIAYSSCVNINIILL